MQLFWIECNNFCGTQFSGDGVLRISSYRDARMRTKINPPPRKETNKVSYKTPKTPAQKLPPPPAKKKYIHAEY